MNLRVVGNVADAVREVRVVAQLPHGVDTNEEVHLVVHDFGNLKKCRATETERSGNRL